MKNQIKYYHILFTVGVIALIGGAIDPLEGSIVIACGSVLISISAYLKKDSFKKLFLISSLMIVFGVCFLFYLSSLGGFGGKSSLSWWWSLLIIPYLLGWLISVIALIVKAFRVLNKKK